MAEDNEVLKVEWINSGFLVLGDDDHQQDHAEINCWIIDLLSKNELIGDEISIVSLVYHSLSFDIPFKATKSIRNDLLRTVRMKMADPD